MASTPRTNYHAAHCRSLVAARGLNFNMVGPLRNQFSIATVYFQNNGLGGGRVAEEIPVAAAAGARSRVQQVAIDEQQTGQRLDRVLTGLLPGVPRSRIFRLIRKGEVRVNGRRASPEQRLAADHSVRLPPVRELSPDAPKRVP